MVEENCYYFDSLGNKKMSPEIVDFLKMKYTTTLFNTERIQDYTSIKCGEFCLAFIRNVHSYNSYLSFLNKFDIENRKNNDTIVKHLY